jgi:hypothetical protein
VRIARALGVALGLALLGGSTAKADDPFRLTSAGSTVANGVYVGPYRGVLGSGPGAPSIDVVCVDYFNDAYLNQQYTVHSTNLGTGWNADAVRFGNTSANSLLAYRQAAWLSWQFASTPPSSAAWGTIHRSIWNIFTPDPMFSSQLADWQTAWNDWYNSAAGQSYDWNSVVVLTDASMQPGTPGIGGRQEFITTTPEPATLLLLSSGLVFVLGLAIKRGGMFA